MRGLWVSLVLVLGCAPMQPAPASSAPAAPAAPAPQQANMEYLCKTTVDAYCARCGVEQTTCGQTYISCLGGHSPADPSAFNTDQVAACGAAVQGGDCTVMPAVWPAACSLPTPTCPGGSSWDGTQCACPAGTSWDGTQCTVPQPAQPEPAQPAAPACSGGAVWDAAQGQCVCPAGSAWDGFQCAAVAQQRPAHQRPPSCRQLLLDRGYGLADLDACKGANARCVGLLLDRGYGASNLAICRERVDVHCMEDLLSRGYGLADLGSCKK